MSGTIVVIRPNGLIDKVRWESPGLPTEDIRGLQRMHDLLDGGYLEHVDVIWEGKSRFAFVDEDGIGKQLADNMTATKLLTRESARSGQILGTMLIWVPDSQYEKAQADEVAKLSEAIDTLTRAQMVDLLTEHGFSIGGSEPAETLRELVRLTVGAEELTLKDIRRFQEQKP